MMDVYPKTIFFSLLLLRKLDREMNIAHDD